MRCCQPLTCLYFHSIAVCRCYEVETPPSNTAVETGRNVTVTCEVKADDDPDMIEWYEYVTSAAGVRIWKSIDNETEVDRPEVFAIVGTFNLVISNINVSYGGAYGCRSVVHDDSVRRASISVFGKNLYECIDLSNNWLFLIFNCNIL